jgi:pimeloyl-ACP methyl ester carboxylesterase
MDLNELERHRHQVTTRSGVASYLAVGEGRPALFVHGLATSSLLWRNVLPLVADRRRCYALDLPLHGKSPGTSAHDFSLPGLAAFVDDLCDALDLPTIDLVAHDTGGAVAQVLAARKPERMASFVLTNCETKGNMPPRAFLPTVWLARLGLLAPIARRGLADIDRTRQRVYGKDYEHIEALPIDIARRYLAPLSDTKEHAKQFQRWVRSLRASDLDAAEDGLHRLDCPTSIVWATDDRFFPRREAQWLLDTIPGAYEIVDVRGARLFFPDERADELGAALCRHWAACERAST